MKPSRRIVLALAAWSLVNLAQAQAWPARPVRIVVPYAPGGSVDVVTRKMATLPEVPTFAEAGIRNFGLVNFTGLWAPRGTPAVVLERLQKEIARAMATPDMRAFAEGLASEPGHWDGASFAKDLVERTAYWGKVAANTAFERQ